MLTEELELIQNTVGMVAITFAQEEVALVLKLVPLVVGSILHDEAGLLKAFADIGIKGLEPTLEFWIFVRVPIDSVDRFDEVI